MSAHRNNNHNAFTLLELLIAVSLLSVIMLVTLFTFNTVTRSWEVGRNVINATGHADYTMEQLVVALRSAYFSGAGNANGFQFEDDGDDSRAHDVITWTKVGRALIGEDAEFTDVPHRITVTVKEPDGSTRGGLTVRVFRQDLQIDEFDPEKDAAEILIDPSVTGFNCRMIDPAIPIKDDEPNWIDEWTKTNTIPTAVELTLWLKPAEEGGEAIESKRVVEIPMAEYSQNPESGSSGNSNSSGSGSGGGNRGSGSGGNRPNTGGGNSGGLNRGNPGGGPALTPSGGGRRM